MKRVYYGTCKSGSGDLEKKVYVPDADIVKDDFNFEEGDLLTVFFAQTNTEDEPSIVIYAQDPEQETSTASDSGKFIKSIDVEAGMNGAWAAGETVIFAYTQKSNGGAYYWELVDAAHATTLLYGNTKLFDEDDLEDLLATTDEDKYSDLALTPRALKKFWDLLKGSTKTEPDSDSDSDPDPDPDPTPTPTPDQDSKLEIGLKWTPSDAVSGQETQPLGTLSLTGSENGIEITYPIDSSISKSIDDIASKIVTHTGQLTNNGNGYNGDGQAIPIGKPDGVAEPFITRIIPENLYFSNGKGLYYGVPIDGSEPAVGIVLNNGENKLSITNSNGIVLNSPTQINGNTSIGGTLITTGAITANNNSTISTGGAIQGGTLYEKYGSSLQPLSQIYSHELVVYVTTTPTYTLEPSGESNSSTHNKSMSIYNPYNYRPIGIVGFNTNADTSKGYSAAHINVWEGWLSGNNNNTLNYGFNNLHSKKRQVVSVSFYILFEKN